MPVCARCRWRNSKSCPKAKLRYKSLNAKRRNWVTECKDTTDCPQFAETLHKIEIHILVMGEVTRVIYPTSMDEAREDYYKNYDIAAQYTQLVVGGKTLNTANAQRYLKGRLKK